MPTIPAQKIETKTLPTDFSHQEGVTWKTISPEAKADIFTYIDNDDIVLKEVIKKYHLVGMTPEDIRFQHYIETSIKKKATPAIEPQAKHKAHQKNHSHLGHGEVFKPNMRTEEVEADENYKKIHQEIYDKKAKAWEKKKAEIIKKWEANKENRGKNIDSEEGQKYLKKHASNPNSKVTQDEAYESFKKKHASLAKKYEQNEIQRKTTYDTDFIGKQYRKQARKHAEERINQKLGKKLKQGKISEEEYKIQAKKIYDKANENWDKKFAKEYRVKATEYAIKQKDPRLEKAYNQIRFGQSKKYYIKKLKEATNNPTKKMTNLQKPTQKKINSIDPNHTVSRHTKIQKKKKDSLIDVVNKFLPKKNYPSQPKDERGQIQSNDIEPVASYPAMPIPTGIQEFTPREIDIESGQRQMLQDYTTRTQIADYPEREEHRPNKIATLTRRIQTIKKLKSYAETAGEIIATSELWVPILIVLLMILTVIIVAVIVKQSQDATNENATQNQADVPITGLTITLKGATTIANGDNQKITYTADITCDTSCQEQGQITIYAETLPKDTTAIPNTKQPYETTPYPMTWKLPEKTATYTITFNLNTTSSIDNTKIALTLKGDTLGKTNTKATEGGAKSSVPSSKNPCGTTYVANLKDNDNFGDPTCDFTKTGLADIITQLDAANKYRWYNVIAWCESTYNPNAFAPPVGVQATLDASGAWGLFQMGTGKNGIYDHGNVYWKDQIANAINYNNKVIGGHFAYWATRNYNPTTCKP